MTIGIEDHQLPYDTHNLYDVTFFTDRIHTLLTHTPSFVDQWLTRIIQQQQQQPQQHPIIVGLDIEWRPNFSRHVSNPVATLQLSIGNDCLIYQVIHSPRIPQSLLDFLMNERYAFVGVGIEEDVVKLVEDYGLSVANAVDLGRLAAEQLGVEELRRAGLKKLGKEVLGKDVAKPKRVSLSRWDSMWLSLQQVQYACLDAFLSWKIGSTLFAAGAGAGD